MLKWLIVALACAGAWFALKAYAPKTVFSTLFTPMGYSVSFGIILVGAVFLIGWKLK